MLRAFGVGFCVMGNHATDAAYEWGGSSWCPKHLPPTAEPDPLEPGYCQYLTRNHFATDGVRWMPRSGKFYCRAHYRAYVLEVIRRGYWHR